MKIPSLLIALVLLAANGFAQDPAQKKATPPAPVGPPPTQANIPYGSHARQVLDFWKAESSKPTPVLFFIHGGGWSGGDKSRVTTTMAMEDLLKAGISVVSINYRFVAHGVEAGLKPPVQAPLHDAARALQFIRSKAGEWNLDKQRIGACGGSAGACSSLWLAMHNDLADPNSADPIARESTRLWCAAVIGAQTSLDPAAMREWMPNIGYGGHAFGFQGGGKDRPSAFQRFYEARDTIKDWINEYSPMAHASADDPPLWLYYSQTTVAVKGEPQKDATHSACFGMMLEEKLKPLGVEMILTYPAKPAGEFKTASEYVLATLKREKATAK